MEIESLPLQENNVQENTIIGVHFSINYVLRNTRFTKKILGNLKLQDLNRLKNIE